MAVVTAGLVLGLAAACGSTTTATPGVSPTTTTSTTTAGHHRGDGGTDRSMGGTTGGMQGMTDDMDGVIGEGTGGHQHSASLPPLASRLAAATETERAAATDLLTRIRATLAPFESEPAARAAGFVPNPNGHRLIHYRNVANRRDGHELDPEHPEGLVYVRNRSGALVLLGAVFTVAPGETAPAPAGDIFGWHTHDPRCNTFLVPAGGCSETFRMLHIWTTTAVEVLDPWTQPFRAAIGHTSAP